MAVLAIRQSAWDAATDVQRKAFRYISNKLALGKPARYEDASSNVWFTFHDWRFKPVHIAYLGCFAANLGDVPGGYTLPEDRDEIYQQLKTWLESGSRTNPLVLPNASMETWQDILDAQGAPAWMRMDEAIPANWTRSA